VATLIFIGTLSAMDTNETNFTIENAAAVQGTYARADMAVVEVALTDKTGSDTTYSDDGPNSVDADTFTYDTGNGPITNALDGEALFQGSYRDQNGVQQSTTIKVFQLQNGDTFVGLPDGVTIQGLTIGRMIGDSYVGARTSSTTSTATVVCFTVGTMILTPTGPRAVETLTPGDKVTTLDHGAQTVRWHHRWQVPTTDRTAPVRIMANTLSDGVPDRDLLVSPQHRIMLRSPIAARMFGAPEVLVPAKKLIGCPGVTQEFVSARTAYAHFMCDRHEIVFANGAPTETLYPGPQARLVISASLASAALPTGCGARARPVPTGKQTQRMIARHTRNNKPLIAALSA
jgi:hypothetical protein